MRPAAGADVTGRLFRAASGSFGASGVSYRPRAGSDSPAPIESCSANLGTTGCGGEGWDNVFFFRFVDNVVCRIKMAGATVLFLLDVNNAFDCDVWAERLSFVQLLMQGRLSVGCKVSKFEKTCRVTGFVLE